MLSEGGVYAHIMPLKQVIWHKGTIWPGSLACMEQAGEVAAESVIGHSPAMPKKRKKNANMK